MQQQSVVCADRILLLCVGLFGSPSINGSCTGFVRAQAIYEPLLPSFNGIYVDEIMTHIPAVQCSNAMVGYNKFDCLFIYLF